MVARLNLVPKDNIQRKTPTHAPDIHVNYYQRRQEQDSFTHKSFIDPVDSPQYSYVVLAVEKMLKDAIENEFPGESSY